LYHYDGLHHRLERIGSAKVGKKAALYAAEQKCVADASAVFIMTAVFPRVLWKYRLARSYRRRPLDTAHLYHTFSLATTWFGPAPSSTAASKHNRIEREHRLV